MAGNDVRNKCSKMKFEFENKATGGRLIMIANDLEIKGEGMLNGEMKHINTIAVNKAAKSQKVIVDEIAYTMPGHTLIPLISNQHFMFEEPKH